MSADHGQDVLAALIDEAIVYAFPVWEIARTRQADADAADPAGRLGPNALRHDRLLGDHTMRWITTPNNDTLYSRAWLDLSAGPVRLLIDEMPAGRYWSVALMDAFSNHVAMLGTRREGRGPVTVDVVGPRHRGHTAAHGGRVIDAPGDDVWLFGRWIVDGPHDLDAARAMQDRLRLDAPTPVAGVQRVAREPIDAASFLALVNELLGRNPPPPADDDALTRWARIGLRPGDVDAWTGLDLGVRRLWAERLAQAPARIRRLLPQHSIDVQGWLVRPPSIGQFGQDHALRAAIALGGLGALEPAEAVYAMRRDDDGGQRLEGRFRYLMRVPPQGLPREAFWSLSMYESTPDGRLFFTDNPIGRYTIGDRTPGLRFDADGALPIAIQHDAPQAAGERANWLPSPPGPFVLILRAYLPRPELRDWQTPMPTLARR